MRRAVVVRLIEDAVARGHPEFQGIQMEKMYSEAKALPEDGVPEEAVAMLPYDENLNFIMRQKAATPVCQEMCADDLAEEKKIMAKPNAVVRERTSVGMAEANLQHVSALQAATARSHGPEGLEEAVANGQPVFGPVSAAVFWFTVSSFARACQTLRRDIGVMSPHHGLS